MKLFLRPFSSLPLIQERLLSVTSESMCTKYWLTAKSSLPTKKMWLGEVHPDMTVAVDLDVNNQTKWKFSFMAHTSGAVKCDF